MEGKTVEKIEYQGELLGEVVKRDGISLLLFSREYKGHPFFEIREWLTNNDYEGPGKQGVTFPPSILSDLTRLLDSVIAKPGEKE
jgi:hypothetical protein